MANYIATARSNYFRVKDKEKFEEWCWGLGLTLIGEDDKLGFVVETNDGQIPAWRVGEDGDMDEVDFGGELASHLVDGEVAIFIEVGAEKLRYVSGYAIAVNSKGETRQVFLMDIYKAAGDLGPNITAAEY